MKTVKTQKGTELPLTNLKGKDYLMVAYRLQWLTEDVPSYTIETEIVSITDEQTVVKANVCLFDKEGKLYRKASATKRETKKDFNDHTEKAETAAIGRALAMLGFGTQHALSDLDEGARLADSPLDSVKKNKEVPTKDFLKSIESPVVPQKVEASGDAVKPSETKPRTTFRKPKPEEAKTESLSNGVMKPESIDDNLGLN